MSIDRTARRARRQAELQQDVAWLRQELDKSLESARAGNRFVCELLRRVGPGKFYVRDGKIKFIPQH